MRPFVYTLLICLGFCSCETEGFQNPSPVPIFNFNATIDGLERSIDAGIDGVENNPGFAERDGGVTYFSNFNITAEADPIIRRVSLQYRNFPRFTSENAIRNEVLNNDLEYVLSFTGVEGLRLSPQTTGINDVHTNMWFVNGQVITTQLDALIPNPTLIDNDFVNVRYNLNVLGKFFSSFNSQISSDREESCAGMVNVEIVDDEAQFSFSTDNPDINQIEWNDGTVGDQVTVDLVPQTLIVEASSDECTTSLQMDIEDVTGIPKQIGFDINEITGPATGQSRQGFVLEILDASGEIFRSDYGIQMDESAIQINNIQPLDFDSNGDLVLLVQAEVDANLFNLDQSRTMVFRSGLINFAFSYPAN